MPDSPGEGGWEGQALLLAGDEEDLLSTLPAYARQMVVSITPSCSGGCNGELIKSCRAIRREKYISLRPAQRLLL